MLRRPATRRRLVPVGLLLTAAIAGVIAGLLSAFADGAPSRPATATSTAVDVPLTTGPMRTARPGVTVPGHHERLPIAMPERPGRDARVVVRTADPYGGPDWAIRTFAARSLRSSSVRPPRRVAQTCAQVGRIVDGLFVWIDPHRPRALGVPVNTTSTTVCTGRSRAVVLGALRLPAAADIGANPQISATVVWGISPRPGTRVALRSPDDALDLPALRGGARLRVVRGDLDVGRRTAVADGKPVDGAVDNAQYGLPSFWQGKATGADNPRLPGVTAGLRLAAVVSDPSSDRPTLLATSREPASGRPCFATVDRLVGGEPVRTVSPTGALAPSSAVCSSAFDVPPGRWTLLGGGASSNSSERDAEHRRLRERRTLAGSSRQAWAFPREITEVDLEDPLGVRTVRTVPVGDASIVYVQRAGDLPVGGLGFFGGEERRVFTGRKADGTTVALRYWRPR
ncbi:hypothetical protein [Patulibacter americanus]|uniref:hypothetical protein n=1 Tax=Patulibacter americanus TaxID=588672 RepID=UPI0003B3BB26|nr:hypothetical protein [Patulibacter americanus]